MWHTVYFVLLLYNVHCYCQFQFSLELHNGCIIMSTLTTLRKIQYTTGTLLDISLETQIKPPAVTEHTQNRFKTTKLIGMFRQILYIHCLLSLNGHQTGYLTLLVAHICNDLPKTSLAATLMECSSKLVMLTVSTGYHYLMEPFVGSNYG